MGGPRPLGAEEELLDAVGDLLFSGRPQVDTPGRSSVATRTLDPPAPAAGPVDLDLLEDSMAVAPPALSTRPPR